MYATFEEVNTFTDGKYEKAKIDLLLGYTQNRITSKIGDITYGVKTQRFPLCDIKLSRLTFDNPMVEKILRINGKEFVGEAIIGKPQKRGVEIKNLWGYADNSQDGFLIEYLSGYKEIPEDIKYAQILLVADTLENGYGRQATKYRVGPTRVDYANGDRGQYTDVAKEIINRYRMFNL